MNQFTLRRYSFGDFLGIADDKAHPALAEERKRIDADGDIPRLIAACGLKRGDAVIDVGGYICDTALPFLWHGCYVTVFEPFVDAYVCGLYNTRHFPETCRCLNAPVGNGEWVRYVYECPGDNFGMRRMEVVPEGTAGAVKTVRLDNCEIVCECYDANFLGLNLIKIDAEGSEPTVLDGAKESIARYRPKFYIEIYDDGLKNRGYTRSDVYDRLRALNYDWTVWGEEPRFDILCTPRK